MFASAGWVPFFKSEGEFETIYLLAEIKLLRERMKKKKKEILPKNWFLWERKEGKSFQRVVVLESPPNEI